MPDIVIEWEKPRPIEQIVNASLRDGKVHRTELIRNLTAREESLADFFRLAASQFGMYPEIVAKVLADSGIGEPISNEQYQHLQRNFVALMERLHREHGGH